ncbi:MAG TPA: hypothetical protein VHX20_09775 [Terracidiphilus sp.]|jgi:hypothetical protein|nr:hypothetical protein [Terracidiphilus sp.]
MYHDPKAVLSPRERVKSVDVVFDKGPVDHSWSVARLEWDGSTVVGIRWNGDSRSTKGLPQARGNPTWFVIPKELEEAVLNAAQEWSRAVQNDLAEGYRQMGADKEREAEAEEWTEGLIGDAY